MSVSRPLHCLLDESCGKVSLNLGHVLKCTSVHVEGDVAEVPLFLILRQVIESRKGARWGTSVGKQIHGIDLGDQISTGKVKYCLSWPFYHSTVLAFAFLQLPV